MEKTMYSPDNINDNPFVLKHKQMDTEEQAERIRLFKIKREQRDRVRAAVAAVLLPVMDEYDVDVYVDVVPRMNADSRKIAFKC
jgi:hypothetical protein